MTAPFDLTIRNGTLSTASETFRADIGVTGGRIAVLADRLPPGTTDIDAEGRWVLPGGIDSHTHIEQRSSSGVMCADDFRSGTISAAFGGTTTIMSFAAQHRGDSLREVVADYHALAAPKAVVDYAFHLIISDPTPEVLDGELPALIAGGIRSFKVYMTYDKLKLDDGQLLDVMSVAQRERAMVMVHAENHEVIQWIARRLLDRGHRAPRFHTVA
ncbi:MAG: amidohydrolase family protein, partial [Burkholderiales bacterium]|nr:amidohydrolase family protein [Burkholderiales bacterium]